MVKWYNKITQKIKSIHTEINSYDEAKKEKKNFKPLSLKAWALKFILFSGSTLTYLAFKGFIIFSINEVPVPKTIESQMNQPHSLVLPMDIQEFIIKLIVFLFIAAIAAYSYEFYKNRKIKNQSNQTKITLKENKEEVKKMSKNQYLTNKL